VNLFGNVFAPTPSWRFGGPLDLAMEPINTLFNRGAFDAAGLPYAFNLSLPGFGGFGIAVRNLQTAGISGEVIGNFLERCQEKYGTEGRNMGLRYFNDQFATARDWTSPSPPDPFWQRSPSPCPLWLSSTHVLTCNSYIAPGHAPVVPPPSGPYWGMGNDLRRWSVYPRTAGSQDPDGNWIPYPLYQTEDAGQADQLPADVYAAEAKAYRGIRLRGRSPSNHGELVIAIPINL